MPRVKIDYIVSFSSEDTEHPASNLLSYDVSSKRWLCARAEPSCSVVLQLSRTVTISSLQVGAHHAALVEVLVGRSETPNEPYKVLVPSCVFLSPAESRRDTGIERVRSFSGDQLSEARAQRWDRVRLVCSQPYNKHCQYGLSFVHVSEAGPARPVLARLSSDEEFSPGELFKRHRGQDTSGAASPSTDALIRQATSQAIKNVSEASTKIVKTPIAKPDPTRAEKRDSSHTSDRQRDSLLYTDDDDKPHSKIDQIVQRHKNEKSKEATAKDDTPRDNKKREDKNINSSSKERQKRTKEDKHSNDTASSSNSPAARGSDRDEARGGRKRKRSREDSPAPAPHRLLQDVVFAISGYVNPERAQLRDAATAMGAVFMRDWSPACTHLICAFPSTPKLQAVRASGAATCAVRGDWLHECARLRRRVPWQWFATRREDLQPQGEQPRGEQPRGGSGGDITDCDTDDEIEKVLNKQKKQKTVKSPKSLNEAEQSRRPADTSARHRRSTRDPAEEDTDDRERNNSHDKTSKGQESSCDVVDNGTKSGGDTDEETFHNISETIDSSATLPDFFEGCTFVIDDSVERRGYDGGLLARYIRAYGGELLEGASAEEGSVQYTVTCGSRGAGLRVSPRWVWGCHARARLLGPHEE